MTSATPRPTARSLEQYSRFRHPNALQVLEVGVTDDDEVFVVTEYPPALAVPQWIRETGPNPNAIVRVFLAASQALGAAHAAGLAHGDFRPASVLLGPATAVKVTGFGLGPVGHAASPDQLTHTAPEHGPATPASDQFSFCVALFESIFGKHPFPSDSPEQRTRAIARARIRFPRVAPGPLRRVLERGLRASPKRRWPSMRVLRLHLELAACPCRSPRASPLALLAAMTVTLTGGAPTLVPASAPGATTATTEFASELRAAVQRAEAGHPAEALAIARRTQQRAAVRSDVRAEASAHLVIGNIRARLLDFSAANSELQIAFTLAEDLGDSNIALRAAAALLDLNNLTQDRVAAQRWERVVASRTQ